MRANAETPARSRSRAGLAFFIVIAVTASLSPALGTACPGGERNDEPDQVPMTDPSLEEVQAVLDRHAEGWMELREVVGTGIGRCEGRLCIRVFVTERSGRVEETIPERVDGIAVELRETDRFEPREPPDR